RQQFAHLFRGAAADPVRAALHAYQNADGGFGNALEPDKRCPDSQPIDQEMALHALHEVGIDAATVTRMCDFLVTISAADGGVPFVLPTVRSAPRAPWWNTEDDPPASLNPTASIAGLLHKHGVRHAWLDRATDYCWRTIDASQLDEPHLIRAIITFLEHAPDQPRARRAFERVATSLFEHELVAIDPDDTNYVKMPLDYAPTPQSWCRRLFSDEVIAEHLAALAARQQPDGGWLITWPPVSPACEMEGRGIVTLNALRTLRAYGQLSDAA
ncbi:MAG: hypothetical protein M3R61_12655, partial [Chloroflexota bacterium]|nr:hypothetical protein [Chloroflexota bacterium]